MKIRTNLFLLSAFFVILIAALGFIVLQSFSQINREIKGSNSANRMIKEIFELNIVTYEYVMRHEERMQQQWMLKYDSIGKLLERMRKEESHPECQSILETIASDYKALGNLFSQLQDSFIKRKRLIEKNKSQVQINITFALEQRLIAQALMRAQKITSGAFKSSIVMQQRIARVQQRTGLIVLFSIIGFIILSFCVSFLTTIAITRPINKLVKSAEIIGEGNLNHRVDIKTKNEIGELAAAFNRMTERRQLAEKRLQHLNLVLRAIRSVNQLIIKETNREKLFQGACDILVKNRGYHSAWIALVDEDGRLGTAVQAGVDSGFPAMVDGLKRGELARCMRQAVDQSGVLLVANPAVECGDCPLAGIYAGKARLTIRLEHEGSVFGFLAVAVPAEMAVGEEEQRLFAEVAGDIAFALHGIKLGKEHRRSEEKAIKSEQRYRTLFEDTVDAIAITSREGKFLDVNQAALDLFGYVRDEIMEMNFGELYIDPSDGKRFQQEIDQKGSVSNFEIKLRKKDGTELDCLFTVNTQGADDGSIVGYQGFIRDMTEHKKLEAQLRQAQKMEAIGTLAGGIAHDFNNILGAIIGYTEIASLQVAEDNKAKESLKEVLKAGRRATDLVKQILAFSRKGEQERIPIQINPIVKEAMKLLRSSLPTTIEIRQNIESDTGIVEADPTQIHQILMNLCANAGHAMREEGGILEVAIRNVEVGSWDSELGYLDMTPGPYLLLTVSDTGEGMTPEVLERIFEPYFTTKEKGVGTGLGLSVVHGIVKIYGGTIRAYSEPGKGTTFHVYLPRIKEAKEMAEEESRPGVIPTGHERILFVDDESALVEIGKQMLERLGYQVVSRTSSIEALELFRVKPDQFDLVITDMTMPNMTGDRLAREIMKVRPDIPIIICTGYSERITEDKAKGMGIKAFVMKPIVIRDLANTVRKALD